MVRQLGLPSQIVGCPIVREADGLAMSSRNLLLSPECRKAAPSISAALRNALPTLSAQGVDAAKQKIANDINATTALRVEYVEMADPETLAPVHEYAPGHAMAFVAVQAGSVRLIDNWKY